MVLKTDSILDSQKYKYTQLSQKKNHKKLSLFVAPRHPSLRRFNDRPGYSRCLPEQESSQTDFYQQGPAEILPQLYLGSSHNACPRILDTYGITCVINVAAEISTPNFGAFPYNNARTPGNRISYHHLPWTHSQDNLAEYEFTRAIRTIEEAQLANTTVLIHCQQGIERSAALVIAYVFYLSRRRTTLAGKKKPLPLDNLQLSISQAYEFVRKRAPCIHPNMELMYQLKEFERKISSTTKKARNQRSGSVHSRTHHRLPNTSALKRPRSVSFREPTQHDKFQHCYTTVQTKKQADQSAAPLPPVGVVVAVSLLAIFLVSLRHLDQRHATKVMLESDNASRTCESTNTGCSQPSTPITPALFSTHPIY